MVQGTDYFLLGPTASGKTSSSLEMAELLQAEIYCLDAFQVYRGLNIGTAKPDKELLDKVTHRMLDILDPCDAFSVADYVETAIRELEKTQKNRLWVGGAGLYYRALTQGLSQAPSSDPTILDKYEQLSLDQLQKIIQEKDPLWAQSADLKNKRRITRALTVIEMTGRLMSDFHAEQNTGVIQPAASWLLHPERDYLVKRIEERVGRMLDQGWIEEVEALLKNEEKWPSSQSYRAIGYARIHEYLQGKTSKKEMEGKIFHETCQYAKRQLTWFRKELNLRSLSIHDSSDQFQLPQRLRKEISRL